MDDAEWLEKHKGRLLRTVGEVWWCGDDWCDCTQAQIVEIYDNKVAQPGVVRVQVWAGDFFTDGETGAYGQLRARREEMKALDPAAEARIQWQD